MPITLSKIIVWLIIGLLGGTLAGAVVRRQLDGFGWPTNLGVGLVGALIGGLLFHLLGIWPGLENISVSLRDIVSAFIGSMLFLLGLWFWRGQK